MNVGLMKALELVNSGHMFSVQQEEVRTRLAFLFPESGKAEHAHDLGSTRAVDDLLAVDPSPCPKADAIDSPTFPGFRDSLREFVVSDFDTRIGAFFFRKKGVKELIGIDLVVPMTRWHFGEVGQFSPVQLDTFLHQFPSDPGDDLFAPGVKKTRK